MTKCSKCFENSKIGKLFRVSKLEFSIFISYMNDSSLISNYLRGNSKAFEKLYKKYIEKIYKFVFYKTMHKETAEDLTSTIFFKALDKLDTFDDTKSKFQTWLFNIARNTVIDHYRTKKPNQNIEDFWGIADNHNLNSIVENNLKIEDVKKVLQTLNTEQREIVLLRVWQGLSYKEIGEIMGKSENACKVSFSRSAAKLKDNVLMLIILSVFINKLI